MRLSLYSVVAILITFGMAYTARPTQPSNPPQSGSTNVIVEGAYRDGLYLGRLHRKQGLPSRPATGRWNREADRNLFLQGYARGYNPGE